MEDAQLQLTYSRTWKAKTVETSSKPIFSFHYPLLHNTNNDVGRTNDWLKPNSKTMCVELDDYLVCCNTDEKTKKKCRNKSKVRRDIIVLITCNGQKSVSPTRLLIYPPQFPLFLEMIHHIRRIK